MDNAHFYKVFPLVSLFFMATSTLTFSAETAQLEESHSFSSEEEKLIPILEEEIKKLDQENEDYIRENKIDKYEGNSYWKELDIRTHRRFLQENPPHLPAAKTQEERQQENERITNEVGALVNRQREFSESFLKQDIPSVAPAEQDDIGVIDRVLAQAAMSGEIKDWLNLPSAEKAVENKFHGNRIPNLLQLKRMMNIPKPEEIK